MSEDKKNKAGLHKKISSIFEGVPIPQSNGAQQSSSVPRPESSEHTPPKPPAEGPQPPQIKASTKADQPVPSGPKVAPVQKPKSETAIKTAGPTSWDKIKNKFFSGEGGVDTRRQKVMAILVPILFIALIFVLLRVFRTPSRKKTKPQEVTPTKTVAKSPGKIDWQIPAPYPTTLRDPMRTSPAVIFQAGQTGTGQIETKDIVKQPIKGILHSEDNPSAIIGTRIVHEGETISGATIVKINKDSVEFEMNGKRWVQEVER